MKTKSWYYRPTAGHETHGQGVIADEETGRDVAIAYDGDADGALLAAAPAMLAALEAIHAALNQPVQYTGLRTPASTDVLRSDATLARNMAKQAIQKATGEA